MNRLKSGTCLLALIMCVLAAASPGRAATATGSQQVLSGGLDISLTAGNVTFTSVTLTGSDQTVPATTTPTIRVKNMSGATTGWNVSLSSGNFTDGTGTIASSNFTFNPTGGTVTAANATTQTVDGTNGPKEAGGGAQVLSSSVKVLTAANNYGRGTYTYNPAASSFQVTVPATTVRGSGTFVGTFTFTINSGP